MSILAGIGVAVAKQAAPHLWDRLVRGRSETVDQVAEMVADVAIDVLDVPQGASEDEVMEALSADPQAFAHVKQMATDLAIKGIERDMRFAELDQQDRASARKMYSTGGGAVQVALVVGAFMLAAASIVLVGYMNLMAIEPTTLTVTMATASLGPVLTVFGFFFGSSSGSKAKTDAMRTDIEKSKGI